MSQKYRMVQAFQAKELRRLLSHDDVMLARRMQRGFQFFSWLGMPHSEVAASLLKMPKEMRTVHVIFGREGVPMDLALDVDAPITGAKSAQAAQAAQAALLDKVLRCLDQHVASRGETIESRVVCQSANLEKASFHVHARLRGAVFADFRSLHGFVAPLKEQVPEIDTQIYRESGSLRLYNNVKEDGRHVLEVVGATVEPQLAMEASLCVRPLTAVREQNLRVITLAPPQRHASTASQGDDPGVSFDDLPTARDDVVALVEKLLEHDIPARFAEQWEDWIKVLLMTKRIAQALEDSAASERLLTAFIKFSRRVPGKFPGNGAVVRRWQRTTINNETKGLAPPLKGMLRLAAKK